MAEKKERKIRFNIIDFLIVIAVIACIVGIALRYNVADRIGVKSNTDTAEVSFIVRDIKQSSADALITGDTFYWTQNGVELGVLTSKSTTPAAIVSENSKGEAVVVYSDYAVDATGVLTCVGTLTDDGFMIGGTQFVAPGKEMEINSKQVKVLVLITDVEVVN